MHSQHSIVTCPKGDRVVRWCSIAKYGVLRISSVTQDTKDVLAACGYRELFDPLQMVDGGNVSIFRKVVMKVPKRRIRDSDDMIVHCWVPHMLK